MATRDVVPSRLERARYRIRDLLAARRGGQTALVAFAAQAFTVTPLTDDIETIRSQLAVLEPGVMPRQGSNIPTALEHGLGLLRQAGFNEGDLLLITDGIAEADSPKVAALLAGSGARLSVMGVGSEAGGPVPQAGGGFVTAADGTLVVSRLDPAALAATAREGGGLYVTATGQGDEVISLAEFFMRGASGDGVAATEERARRWQDAGIWLLPPLLLLGLLAFRPGVGLALLALALLPPTLRADWFRTPDQRAREFFEQGDYRAAGKLFESSAWRAASAYRENDFEVAAKALEDASTPDALYNRGNARARLGQYPQAVGDYEAALRLRPDFPDARHNLELVREQLAEEEQEKKKAEEDSRTKDEKQEQQGEREGEQGQNGKEGQEGEAEEGASEAGKNRERKEGQDQQAQENAERGAQRGQQEDDAEGSADASAEDDGERKPPEGSREARAGAPGDTEQQLATEQWLRQIPDDPGGLWRRKFLYQYRQREAPQTESDEPW
jgi:Ca-activated chloride channel family protein